MTREKKENHARKSATALHHPGSPQICSADLPFPSATRGHLSRCAAFWVAPQSHLSSSLLPITLSQSSGGEGRLTDPNLNPSGLPAAYHRPPYGISMYVMSFKKNKNKNKTLSHCLRGPLSVTRFVRPLIAWRPNFSCRGLECTGWACLMPAGVAISGCAFRLPRYLFPRSPVCFLVSNCPAVPLDPHERAGPSQSVSYSRCSTHDRGVRMRAAPPSRSLPGYLGRLLGAPPPTLGSYP